MHSVNVNQKAQLAEWVGGGALASGVGALTENLAMGQFSGLVNSVEYGLNEDGIRKLGFNEATYGASTFGTAALAGYASSFVGAATTTGLTGKLDGFGELDAAGVKSVASLSGGLATMGTEYAITGHTSMNLFNMDVFGIEGYDDKTYSKGLLEMHIGKNGISTALGSGGVDMSYNKIANAVAGMDAFKTQQEIRQYDASGETDYADDYEGTTDAGTALRSNYSFGEEEGRAQLEAILDGTDKLKVGYIGHDGQTTLENGGLVVNLATLGQTGDLNSQLAAGVVLGHEAYRDGIIGNEAEQNAEALRAVNGHTEMAKRIADDGYGYGFILNNDNLRTDLKNYAAGEEAFKQYVDETYDSTKDYWKLITRADGTHELQDDGNKYLTIEYQDKDGNILSSIIPGGEEAIKNANSMGWAASLTNVVGMERASQILGSDLLNTNLYDTQTLKDVLKMSDEEIFHIQTTGTMEGLSLSDNQKMSLAGEAMLKGVGASWNGNTWVGTGSLSDLVTMTDKEVLNGSIVSKYVDGEYSYSAVSQDIARDPRSYFIMANGEHNSLYDGLDNIEVTQWDLNNNQLGDTKVFDNFTWTQTMIPSTYSYNDFIDMQYGTAYGAGSVSVGPETIAEGSMAYKLLKMQGSNDDLQLYNGDTYLQAVSGNLLAPDYSIGANGNANYNIGRHLIHPANSYGNTGCGVTNNKDDFTEYTSYLTDILGLEVGTVLFGDIYQKYDPYLHVYY